MDPKNILYMSVYVYIYVLFLFFKGVTTPLLLCLTGGKCRPLKDFLEKKSFTVNLLWISFSHITLFCLP